MALSDHVTITLSKQSLGIARAGFGVPLILSATASWTEHVRFYSDLPGVLADFPATTGPEYLAAQAMFGQSPKPTQIAIGKSTLPPTQKYQVNVSTVAALNHYLLNITGQGVTATAIDVLTTSGDLTITLVTNASDLFTSAAHGMTTGDGPYRYSTGTTLPSGLAVDTNYWVIVIDADTFKLASSKANALALTPINITTDGSGSQTLRRVQNDVICAQLVQALNAVVGKNFTATQVTGTGETDYVEVTANAAGNWFSVEVVRSQDLATKQTHVDPGVATDLNLCLLDNDAWYALYTLYNSHAYVMAAAAWIEATTRVYSAEVNETEAITVSQSSGTDTLKALQTSAYTRTMGAFHPSPQQMFGAAWFGRTLPDDPGSETWNDKTLAGVAVVKLSTTNRKNLTDRSANSYQAVFTNFNKTFRGTCADGEFFDTIRGLDFFVDDASKSIYEVIANSEKVPYEDDGIALIEGALRGAVKRSIIAKIIAAGTDSYEVPLASSVSANDRTNRVLNGLKFSFRLSGAIQSANVTGVVTA